MTPRLRKLGLTAHITFSIGWLGAVTAFLVLSITGLTSQDPELMILLIFIVLHLTGHGLGGHVH